MLIKTKRIVALMLAFCVAFTFMPFVNGTEAVHAATKAHSSASFDSYAGTDANHWNVVLSTDKASYQLGETIKLNVEGTSHIEEPVSWIGIYDNLNAPQQAANGNDLSYYWAYTGEGETAGDVSDFVIYGSNKDARVNTNVEITKTGTYYIVCVTQTGKTVYRYAILPITIVPEGDYRLILEPEAVLDEPILEQNLPGVPFANMYDLGGHLNMKVVAPADADDEMWIGFFDAAAAYGQDFGTYISWLNAKEYSATTEGAAKTFDFAKVAKYEGTNQEKIAGYRAVALFAEGVMSPIAVEYFYVRPNHDDAEVVLGPEDFVVKDGTPDGHVEFVYNGQVQKPTLQIVRFDSSDPMKYVQRVETPDSVNVGTYTATVILGGKVCGKPTAEYQIVPKTMTEDMIGKIADQKWTGGPVKPAVTVKMGDVVMKEGTDYSVAYRNNINAGTATVIVTGKGNFTQSARAEFKIVKEAAPDQGGTQGGTTTPDQGGTTTPDQGGTTTPEHKCTEAVAATCTTPAKCSCGKEVGTALGHAEVVDAAVAATCTTAGKTEGKHCSRCSEVLAAQTEVPATGHAAAETVTKATAAKAGQKVTACTTCGEVLRTTVIKAAKVSLSKTGANFTGKKIKAPVVRVKTAAGKTISSKYYTVTKSKNTKTIKAIDRYTYTVKFKATCPEYTGTVKLTFDVKPVKTTIKAPAAAKRAITVKWKAVPKAKKAQVTGYEVQVATNKAFTKGVKKATVKGYAKVSKKVTGLKSKTKYFVKVRTYKTVKGVKIYSDWSAVKTIKAK